MAFPFLLRLRASFARSFVHRGRLGTLAFMAYYPLLKLQQRVVRFTPGFKQWHAAHHTQDMAFDAAHGFDTSGKLYPELSQALGENRFYGNFYLAVPADEFRAAMAHIPINHGDYIFVDYGSGKGRALLLAAEYHFSRIIGIEYALELHLIAQRNIVHYQQIQQMGAPFELHCMDAADYELPLLPAVVFMHNPFGEPVIESVLAAIRRSLAGHVRDLWVIYHYPFVPKPFAAADFLKSIYICDAYHIYRVTVL